MNDILLAQINKCTSWAELVDLALSALQNLKKRGSVYHICGPMSTGGFNDRALNLKVFRNCIDIANENGLIVFNQLPFQDTFKTLGVQSLHKQPILEEFYRPYFKARLIDTVLFLPTWASSFGSTWERNYLQTLGTIKIEEYPQSWYNQALEQL